jgi:hypothetical protein
MHVGRSEPSEAAPATDYAPGIQCFRASTRNATMVFSPSALAASSRRRPSTSTKRAPSALTRIGACRPCRECWPRSRLLLLFEGRTTFDRNVDVGNRDDLALHHYRSQRIASPNLRQFYPISWTVLSRPCASLSCFPAGWCGGNLGVLEDRFIVVGRTDHRADHTARGHLHPRDLDVPKRLALQGDDRAIKPQGLLTHGPSVTDRWQRRASAPGFPAGNPMSTQAPASLDHCRQ